MPEGPRPPASPLGPEGPGGLREPGLPAGSSILRGGSFLQHWGLPLMPLGAAGYGTATPPYLCPLGSPVQLGTPRAAWYQDPYPSCHLWVLGTWELLPLRAGPPVDETMLGSVRCLPWSLCPWRGGRGWGSPVPRGWPGVLTAPRCGCSSGTLQGTVQGLGCAQDLGIFLGVGGTEELNPPEKAVGRRGERRGAVLGRSASRRARKVWGSVRGEGVRTPPGITAGGRTRSPGWCFTPNWGGGWRQFCCFLPHPCCW